MTAVTPLTVGWCPGALRPMESGDGLIVRIKPRAGILDLARAEALGRLALRHGNGLVDLTGRANLQIRGVTRGSLPPLTLALQELDLLDQSAAAEAIRNIVVSPLAGLDQRSRYDMRPVIQAIEEHLVRHEDLHALPAKWSIVVDDGGPLSLEDVPADLRIEAISEGLMQIGLADDTLRATCSPDQAADVVVALSRLALEGPTSRRMRDLVKACGAATLFLRIGLDLATSSSPRRALCTATDVVGWHEGQPVPFFGVAAPFGSLDAEELVDLAIAARATGGQDMRLTPWRVLLLTDIGHAHAAALARSVERTDLIVDSADPRLAFTACSGAPACHRASTRTRNDADVLARLIADAPPIHVSGCQKGCAKATATPWTLVARDGRYDLVRNGRVTDAPVARGLCIEDAARWISHAQGTRTQ